MQWLHPTDGDRRGGSLLLFLAGAGLLLFAATSLGMFLATMTRSMPQYGMLVVLVLLPLQLLSGNSTPRESMPQVVQAVMLVAPTTHFVAVGQAILFRGAGFSQVWSASLALSAFGVVLFAISVNRFRKATNQL